MYFKFDFFYRRQKSFNVSFISWNLARNTYIRTSQDTRIIIFSVFIVTSTRYWILRSAIQSLERKIPKLLEAGQNISTGTQMRSDIQTRQRQVARGKQQACSHIELPGSLVLLARETRDRYSHGFKHKHGHCLCTCT